MTAETDRRTFLKVGAGAGLVAAGALVAGPAAAHTAIVALGDGDVGQIWHQACDADHVGLRWQSGPAPLVRWRTARGWSSWHQSVVDHHLSDDAPQTYARLVPSGVVDAVEVKATGSTVGVEVLAIVADTGHPSAAGVLDVVPGTSPAPSPTPSPAPAPPPAPPRMVPQPPVITRAEWGARPPSASSPTFPVKKLVVHHAADDVVDQSDVPRTLRAIQAYHMDGRGFSDIAYNFLVAPDGRVYEGRKARDYAAGEIPTDEDTAGKGVRGAHSQGTNTASMGVCLLGDFTSHLPPATQQHGVVTLLAWEADRHGIDPHASSAYSPDMYDPPADGQPTTPERTFADLCGHRDVRQTACPGDAFYPHMDEIRDATSALLGAARSALPGYWIASTTGRIVAAGCAPDLGQLATKPASPLLGGAATPSGRGLWLLGADGGIFSFGDAGFYGSTGGTRLNKPVVGMAATPSGNGYWLVASDGGIFSYGDAGFYGSTGSIRLNKPIVGMAPTPSGNGYWLVASDGGIFSYGNATFQGSVPGSGAQGFPGAISVTPTRTGAGYVISDRQGGVYSFGDAPFHGAAAFAEGAAALVARR